MIAIYTLAVLVALLLTAIGGGTLWWMLHAWSDPLKLEATGYAVPEGPASSSFSLIVPCRDEPEIVMRATLKALLAQDHPDFEVIISVGDDDRPTVEIAHRLARTDSRVMVSINSDRVKNKPRQLNTSLAMCTKEVVGIIDAESVTQPGLLRHVEATFHAEQADVVQGAVHLMNHRARWFTLRNCMEYRVWFRSRLHGHAVAGFIPLGGNTVFTKRALLEEVGGWDGDCLAEDCEIGVRLSVLGKKIVCAYDSELTTLEEAPETVQALIKQRTRWALGFMQVLAKGEWKQLPTRKQRFNAWWTLVQQHAMAFVGVSLPLAIITGLFVPLPIGIVLLSFLPAASSLAMVLFELVILHDFGKDMQMEVRLRDYAKLVLSTPGYQVLMAVASCRALWKYVTGDLGWEKTAHSGAHLAPALKPVLAA